MDPEALTISIGPDKHEFAISKDTLRSESNFFLEFLNLHVGEDVCELKDMNAGVFSIIHAWLTSERVIPIPKIRSTDRTTTRLEDEISKLIHVYISAEELGMPRLMDDTLVTLGDAYLGNDIGPSEGHFNAVFGKGKSCEKLRMFVALAYLWDCAEEINEVAEFWNDYGDERRVTHSEFLEREIRLWRIYEEVKELRKKVDRVMMAARIPGRGVNLRGLRGRRVCEFHVHGGRDESLCRWRGRIFGDEGGGDVDLDLDLDTG